MKKNLRCASIYNKNTKRWLDEELINPYCYNFGINTISNKTINKTICTHEDI